MEYDKKLQDTLTDPELLREWNDTIKSTIDDNDEAKELLEWIKDFRDEFLELSKIVSDQNDLKKSNILRYIQIKVKWMTLNTQMQYQVVKSDGPDREIMVKGSIISRLLEKHEECLSNEEINKITEYLSEPLKSFRRN